MKKTFRDVIRECNKFSFETKKASLFKFFVLQHDKPVGYILPKFISDMDWNVSGFEVNKWKQTVHLYPEAKGGEDMRGLCQDAFFHLCTANIDKIDGLREWISTWSAKGDAENHPILGLTPDLCWMKVPSPLRGVFGIVTAGSHMTMYTFSENEYGRRQMYIWVAKRSQNVTYPGKLDQLVAGALGPDDRHNPHMALAREAREEAGLKINLLTAGVRTAEGKLLAFAYPGPRISFYDEKTEIAGTEHGQLEPGIRYTYSLQVDQSFTPEPHEPNSIAGFYLMSVNDVKTSLLNDQWKPNCALAMLSFLEEMDEIWFPEEGPPHARTHPLRKDLPFDWL